MASNVYVVNGNNDVVYSTQRWDNCRLDWGCCALYIMTPGSLGKGCKHCVKRVQLS